jgi:alpha-beta hydrolase superfamily lysophospholipase
MRENVLITTDDDVRIAGHFYPVAQPKGWALLLHMMPATKESYAPLATVLQDRGIASLAIDFRGHGESEGGPEGYQRFSDAEQQAKIRDVEAAHRWLQLRGQAQLATKTANGMDLLLTPPEHITTRLVVVGASIGANLALQKFVEHPATAGAVLLSPGLEYHGIRTEPLARELESVLRLRNGRSSRVLLVAGGTERDEYSTRTVEVLGAILGSRAVTEVAGKLGESRSVRVGVGHGTAVLEDSSEYLQFVADWITQTATTP